MKCEPSIIIGNYANREENLQIEVIEFTHLAIANSFWQDEQDLQDKNILLMLLSCQSNLVAAMGRARRSKRRQAAL